MENNNTKQYKKDSVGIYNTTFKTGKLAGKRGMRGTVTPEIYNELIGKLTPGCTFMLVENEFKKDDKHPDYRMFIMEPKTDTNNNF